MNVDMSDGHECFCMIDMIDAHECLCMIDMSDAHVQFWSTGRTFDRLVGDNSDRLPNNFEVLNVLLITWLVIIKNEPLNGGMKVEV